jgi:low temperature requirement protein LtrA
MFLRNVVPSTGLHGVSSEMALLFMLLIVICCCWLYFHATEQAADRKANNSPIRKLNSHSTLQLINYDPERTFKA